MALSRSKPALIPQDAVRLSEQEALTYQWKIIQNWDKPSEVWALRYSGGVLAGLSSMTGIYVNNHFRKKLKLGTYGRFSSYLPIVVVPAMFSIVVYRDLIQRSIILNPLRECPLCIQLRSAVFQTGLGVVYPTVLAPFAAFMFATRHFTYRLPSITEQPKEVWHLYKRLTRPILGTLGTLCAIQGIAALYLTGKSIEESLGVLTKLKEIERKVEEELEAKRMLDI